MNNKGHFDVMAILDKHFDELYSLETIIKLTQANCIDKESTSNYYGLSSDLSLVLSQERNNYINMLEIALDKVYKLKQFSSDIEGYCYNNTPTIAADK